MHAVVVNTSDYAILLAISIISTVKNYMDLKVKRVSSNALRMPGLLNGELRMISIRLLFDRGLVEK